MKLVTGFVASVALFGGAHFLHDYDGRATAAASASSNIYRLTANGDEGKCAVTRETAVSDGLSCIAVGPDCVELLPGLEQARFWREQRDGTVTFSANGIDPIVTFSVADGEGYESFAPANPLLSLTPETGERPRD
ncbi:MAG: hypothetical protein J0I79_27500 [Mesorhizobium sp.]|uniref:hypothetical protein n=1 Tax=Mesorhizobium sp. TaxID=1871066 RepID=UPI001ACBECD1|nr:hypothetical protein [Mesorhizobium sp.]MBN9221707.1 hypothetical protein [Mesorhizobium sp.]